MTDARDRWNRLSEVFSVYGAEGVTSMLSKPLTAAEDFAEAMAEVETALVSAATDVFPDLRARREKLAARIVTVNEQYDEAYVGLASANAVYWRSYETDSTSESTSRAATEQTSAMDAVTAADRAVGELEADVRSYTRDLEEAEDVLARSFTKISGGDEVLGAWNAEVDVAQSYFGSSSTSYPSDPSKHSDFADSLRDRISTAVENRVTWLTTGDPEKVKDWVDSHPDFASAVGFVDVERAAGLWSDLSRASTRGDDGSWATGPLAQALALAPFVIGNLNGIPATARNEFNRRTLDDLLAGDLDAKQREQLEGLRGFLQRAEQDSGASAELLSLFLDSADGSARASVGIGDIDNADQITTLSHGIEEDLGKLDPWGASDVNMYKDLNRELLRADSAATSAVVLFMEWDSGSKSDVLNIERPDGGAERLAQLLRGDGVANPRVQRDLDLHSLATTMGAQMMADNPGLVDNAWLYGSAGISTEAAKSLERQIFDGVLTVHATHATDDWVAPLGRPELSEHPVDPRDIVGVQDFSSDGGVVKGFRSDKGEYGERTEGHNSQASAEWFYRIDGWVPLPVAAPYALPIPVMDDVAVGYLDPDAQSYKQAIVDHVRAILDREANR
ncbi:MAG: hypothetical protein IJG47_07710 [Microbacterium sp.]|nr:hypothetical protein [Microbacterium sp.]